MAILLNDEEIEKKEYKIVSELSELFIKNFGDGGIFLLNREIKKRNIWKICLLSNSHKRDFALQLIDNVFNEIHPEEKVNRTFERIKNILEIDVTIEEEKNNDRRKISSRYTGYSKEFPKDTMKIIKELFNRKRK